MRILMLTTLIFLGLHYSFAQHTQSRQETINWLQKNLTLGNTATKQKTTLHNTTNLCRINKEIAARVLNAKDFTMSINSAVSWKQGELDVHNDIYEDGKLKESLLTRCRLQESQV